MDFKALIQEAQSKTKPAAKVLAVSGSPRPGGNSDSIIKQIEAGLATTKIESKSINLSTIDFKGCVGCEKYRKDKVCTRLDDGMSPIYPAIIRSQGLILCCPVHNYNITAWMKAFIDRMYCFYEFDNSTRPRQWYSRLAEQHRKVVIVAICEQEKVEDMGIALEAMQLPMTALGYDIVGSLPLFKAFEKGAIKKQEEAMSQAFELGVKLGQAMQ